MIANLNDGSLDSAPCHNAPARTRVKTQRERRNQGLAPQANKTYLLSSMFAASTRGRG